MASYTYKLVENTENTKRTFHLGQLSICHDPFTIQWVSNQTSWGLKMHSKILKSLEQWIKDQFRIKTINIESSWEDHNPDYTPKDGKYNQKGSQSWSIPSKKEKKISKNLPLWRLHFQDWGTSQMHRSTCCWTRRL